MSTKTEESPDKQPQVAFVNLPYLQAVESAGGIPVPIPNTPAGVELALLCSGIILTGGGDVDPSYYGEKVEGTEASSIDASRDRTENAIISHPFFSSKPVLGICRGMQSLTAFQGGKLIQDIPSLRKAENGMKSIEHNQKGARNEFTHSIDLVEGSLLMNIFKTSSRRVNSMHHQAIVSPPQGWRVSAYSEDGIIEAIELPGSVFRVGVQWHPEELFKKEALDGALFRTLVKQSETDSQERAGIRTVAPD